MIFKKYRRPIMVVIALIVLVLSCAFIFLRLILTGQIPTPPCSSLAKYYQKGSYSGLPDSTPTTANYIWENENLKTQFLSANWNNITTRSLQKENYSCTCPPDSNWNRLEGGMSHVCFYASGTPLPILPINFEEKAASFVAMNRGGLARRDHKLVGNTATVPSGYFVQAIDLNTFGCRDHREQKVIFLVTRDGTIEEVAREKLSSPTEPQPEVCVD